jgi:spermidine synthase
VPEFVHRCRDLLGPGFVSTGVIASGSSLFQEYVVHQTESLGRVLVIDGDPQVAELDEFIYNEALTVPAMLGAARRKRALLVGCGSGGALRQICAFKDVQVVDVVDIDQDVVAVCRSHLDFSGGSFDDHRVNFHYVDIADFVLRSIEYDVIIIDIGAPDIRAFVDNVFEFRVLTALELCLAPGGCLGIQVQSTHPTHFSDCTERIAALRRCFEFVSPYRRFIPSFGAEWVFAICARSRESASRLAEEGTWLLSGSLLPPRSLNCEFLQAAFIFPPDIRFEAVDYMPTP